MRRSADRRYLSLHKLAKCWLIRLPSFVCLAPKQIDPKSLTTDFTDFTDKI